ATISLPLEAQFGQLWERVPDDAVPVYRAHYAEHAPGMTTLLPGVREALALAVDSGLPLGVATSKGRDASRQLLEHLGVLDRFRMVIGPEDVANPKPAPDAIHAAAAALGVDTADMAYIGDSPFDIRAAKAAGARAIAVSTGYCSAAELWRYEPDVLVHSLLDAVRAVTQA
ncbi:MAG: HAD family hydrolase, partial [Candidatus Hydrogenedentota bacterium]